jgi:hypothetical protein
MFPRMEPWVWALCFLFLGVIKLLQPKHSMADIVLLIGFVFFTVMTFLRFRYLRSHRKP